MLFLKCITCNIAIFKCYMEIFIFLFQVIFNNCMFALVLFSLIKVLLYVVTHSVLELND